MNYLILLFSTFTLWQNLFQQSTHPMPDRGYPFIWNAHLFEPIATHPDTLELLFLGDLMQHQAQINAAKTSNNQYNYDSCFYFIAPYIAKADYTVATFETTLAGKPYSGFPLFSAPDDFAKKLSSLGVDLLSIANNHICDKGLKGVTRTIDIFDEFGLNYIGAYKNQTEKEEKYPFIINQNGFCIAFLAYTFSTNGIPITFPLKINMIDTVQIKKDIALAKKENPDFIIALMHWGVEYKLKESVQQRSLAHFLQSQGVNIIIGSHPHVIQPMHTSVDSIANIKTVTTYSLGNAVSNQNDQHTNVGAMVHLTLIKDSVASIHNAEYSLIYRYRIIHTNGKREYYILPENEFYSQPNYFKNADYQKFKNTIDETRERLKHDNNNFKRRTE